MGNNGIFFFVIAIFTVPVGQISGKYGLKKSMVVATLFIYYWCSCSYFSISSVIFFISRIIQGIGGAFLSVASMALVVSAFKPQERGKAIGITVTGVYLATSLSPVIGGFFKSYCRMEINIRIYNSIFGTDSCAVDYKSK